MPRKRLFWKRLERPARRPPYPENVSGRCEMPPDPPIEIPEIEMSKPFRFGGDVARRLMRREVGAKEAFTLRDAAGVFWRASVQDIGPSGGAALPYERMSESPESVLSLTLACAVLSRQRMLFVAQKATELGVARVVPLVTEHSVQPRDFAHEKAHAWPGQIVRAAKQCRRASLPELTAPRTLDAFLASPAARADLSLYLDDVGGRRVPAEGSPGSVVLYIGPEGGFSDAERGKLEGRARPWLLGGRVLRAETAVVVGLAAVQLAWGDFRTPAGE